MGDDEINREETELVDVSGVSEEAHGPPQREGRSPPPEMPVEAPGRTLIANLRHRFAAFLIDSAILFYLYWFLGAFARRALYGSWDGPIPCYGWQGLVFHGCFLFVAFLYYFILEGVLFTTPGKFLCWMYVRRKDGDLASMSSVFVRNMFRPVDYLLPFLPIICMELTRARQRLGDLIAGTTVVKKYAEADRLYIVNMSNIASASGRIVSSLFDLMAVGSLTVGYLLFLSPDSPALSKWLLLLSPLVPMLYFVLSESLTGTSPGKWLFGYIITQEDGTPVQFSSSVVRTFMRAFDLNPIGLTAMWLSRNKQRLGDLAGDTLVSRQKRRWPGGVALVILFTISSIVGLAGYQNPSSVVRQGFRFNFLPSLEIMGAVAEESGYKELTLTHFRFAAGSENTIRMPPVFQPGETVNIIFDIYGYQRSGRMVWIQEDLEVRYPNQSIGLHQENIIDFHQVISTRGPIELANKFNLPPTAKDGTYTLDITVRDLFAHERTNVKQTFEVKGEAPSAAPPAAIPPAPEAPPPPAKSTIPSIPAPPL